MVSFITFNLRRTSLVTVLHKTWFLQKRTMILCRRKVSQEVMRTMSEHAVIAKQLKRGACQGISSRYGMPNVQRRCITYDQKKHLAEIEGYDIKMLNSGKRRDSRINGHYALLEKETGQILPLTHSKMSDGKSELPMVCAGDIVGNPAHTAEKSFLQRLGIDFQFRIVNPNWCQLERLNYKNVCTVIKMRKIYRKNPDDFYEFQDYYRKKIHDNKNMDWSAKNDWTEFFVDAFIEWQEIKNIKKK